LNHGQRGERGGNSAHMRAMGSWRRRGKRGHQGWGGEEEPTTTHSPQGTRHRTLRVISKKNRASSGKRYGKTHVMLTRVTRGATRPLKVGVKHGHEMIGRRGKTGAARKKGERANTSEQGGGKKTELGQKRGYVKEKHKIL